MFFQLSDRASRNLQLIVAWNVIALQCLAAFGQDDIAGAESSASTDEISLDGWPAETFALPPGFAPALPKGEESLLFAPGWRDPNSDAFWSYAFVMSIEEAAPNAARVDELLEIYYTGLMAAFGVGQNEDVMPDHVRVEVRGTGPKYEASMHLIDGFATFKPIDLRVVVETVADREDHSFVRIQVSSQPKGHEIWRSLESAIEQISNSGDLLPGETDKASPEALDFLKDRATYATLDKAAVEEMAMTAKAHWDEAFSGFAFVRVEQFEAGGMMHWMSLWSHKKTGLEFVLVPGGTFQMGSPPEELHREDDERQHEVTVGPFLIARTECTWAAWDAVAGEMDLARENVPVDSDLQEPVSGFSPWDVDRWCAQAGLALPTEAQWEYMCRAGTTTAWAMGADKSALIQFGNVGSAECPESWTKMGLTESWHDGYGVGPAAVATFAPNAFGLFDVHGNLCEWCRDFFESYDVQANGNLGIRQGISRDRIARGGNFGGAAAHARSADRLNVGKGISPGANKGFGFRPSVDLQF